VYFISLAAKSPEDSRRSITNATTEFERRLDKGTATRREKYTKNGKRKTNGAVRGGGKRAAGRVRGQANAARRPWERRSPMWDARKGKRKPRKRRSTRDTVSRSRETEFFRTERRRESPRFRTRGSHLRCIFGMYELYDCRTTMRMGQAREVASCPTKRRPDCRPGRGEEQRPAVSPCDVMQVLQGEPRGQVDNASSAHDPVLSLSLSLSLSHSLSSAPLSPCRTLSFTLARGSACACVRARARVSLWNP